MSRAVALAVLLALTCLWVGTRTFAGSKPRHRHTEQVTALAVGGDRACVYSVSFDETVARIPKSAVGKVVTCETGGDVHAGCLVKGGDLLVGGNLPGECLLRLNADLEVRKTLRLGATATITSLHDLGHPRYGAITAANQLLVFDVETGEVSARTPIHGGFLERARSSPGGTYLAVTSRAERNRRGVEPCRLSVFAADGALQGTWDFPSCAEYRGAHLFLPDEKSLLLVTRQSVRTFKLPPGKDWAPSRTLGLELPECITAAAPGRKKHELLVAVGASIFRLDCKRGRVKQLHVAQFSGQTSRYFSVAIRAIVLAPTSKRVFYGGRDGGVYQFKYK